MTNRNVLLGLLAGVAAGALLGVLFAPEKGSATIKKISKKSEDYAEGLTEKFNEFIDTLNEKFDSVKEGIENVKTKAKAAKDDLRSATS